MFSFFETIIAIFIFAPFLLFGILFFAVNYKMKDTFKSFRLSADLSTIFFILSVHFLVLSIWRVSLFPYIMIYMVYSWGYPAEVKQKFDYKKLLRASGVLIFSFCSVYIILMIYGLLSSAFKWIGK